MSEKLTVLIPCKDEQRNIRACIESVRPVADEILVADSGSTDATLEIVHQIGGCRLIEREYGYCASFKNWAIPQAKYPWVLLLDADERLTEKMANSIRSVLQDPPEHLDAYWVAFECFFLGRRLKYSGWNTNAIRLFRRDVCRYEDRLVHGDIDIDRSRVGRLDGKLLHYSIYSYDQYLTKYARYTTLGAQTLQSKGKRATFASLLLRPMLRFFSLYVLRGGFLDGLPGLQVSMLMAYYNTFLKQAKLWELSHGDLSPNHETERAAKNAADSTVMPIVPSDNELSAEKIRAA